ncbi:hypothetical protein H0H92_004704 [Tricholoma furcatifolium]|nr:hypothetical protein H0H92_004704 [Tricholoma furcatifolium]
MPTNLMPDVSAAAAVEMVLPGTPSSIDYEGMLGRKKEREREQQPYHLDTDSDVVPPSVASETELTIPLTALLRSDEADSMTLPPELTLNRLVHAQSEADSKTEEEDEDSDLREISF